MSDKTAAERIVAAAEQAMVDLFSGDRWFTIDHTDKPRLPLKVARDIWSGISWSRVVTLAAVDMEERIAKRLVAAVVQEMGRDIKQAMADPTLRAEVRGLISRRMWSEASRDVTSTPATDEPG